MSLPLGGKRIRELWYMRLVTDPPTPLLRYMLQGLRPQDSLLRINLIAFSSPPILPPLNCVVLTPGRDYADTVVRGICTVKIKIWSFCRVLLSSAGDKCGQKERKNGTKMLPLFPVAIVFKCKTQNISPGVGDPADKSVTAGDKAWWCQR